MDWKAIALECAECGLALFTRQDVENHDGAHGSKPIKTRPLRQAAEAAPAAAASKKGAAKK